MNRVAIVPFAARRQSMDSSKTRVAVAGAGYIGLGHMEAVQHSQTCALSAIVDPAPAAEAIASKAGVPFFQSLEELFEKARPDGVILVTPIQVHFEHAMKCIEAGLPTLVEKPIAATLAEAQRLVQVATKRKAKLLIGHHRAHSPIMAKARQIVEQGTLGRLVAVMGSAAFYKPDEYFREASWRREPGAGPILLNMIQEVQNLRMLCGEIVAVQALSSYATRGFPVEDTVAINFRFANGTLGTFMLSDTAACARSWEHTSQENKAYPTYTDEDCYVITGTFGSLSIPTMRLKTYAREEDRSWWNPFEAGVVGLVRDDPLKYQIEHFGAVIRGEAEPLISARDGLANLRVTEAIVEAAKTGAVISTAP
jgi:predicted dehydrogenase